jgi:hypothetical protein
MNFKKVHDYNYEQTDLILYYIILIKRVKGLRDLSQPVITDYEIDNWRPIL